MHARNLFNARTEFNACMHLIHARNLMRVGKLVIAFNACEEFNTLRKLMHALHAFIF